MSVHAGRTTSGSPQHGGDRGMSRPRMAAWTVAALILLAPLVAMQFTDEVNWSASDFVFAAVLLFGTLGVYEVVARRAADTMYRAAAGVALAAAFLLVWVNAAVGITDSGADALYLGVIGVGIGGAMLARFRPRGMAYAMVAAAGAVALVGVIALISGVVPAHNPPLKIVGITGFFAMLFAGSAGLFLEAARGKSARGAA